MRDRCISCGAKLIENPIYVFNNMPAQSQNLPEEYELEKDKPVDLYLCQCSGCGLVQFKNDPVSYYLDSTRAGERSEVLIEMRRNQYSHLITTYGLQGKKIIEIGAGKGGFIKTLQEMGELDVETYGIEHSKTFVKIARDDGINVSEGNPESICNEIDGAPFDAFVSFAYPARLIYPNEMLIGVRNILSEGG